MPIISLNQCTAEVSNNLYSTYREAADAANAAPISLIWASVTAGVSAGMVAAVIQSIEDTAINNIYVHTAAISLVTCLSFLAVYMIGKKKINTAQWVVSEADARHSRAKREAQEEEQRRAQEEQRQAEAFKQAAVERQSLSGIAAAQQQSATSSAPSTEAVTPPLPTLIAEKKVENGSVDYYTQIQETLAARRKAQTDTVQIDSSTFNIPDVAQAPVLFSSNKVNEVLENFYKKTLEPFFNGFVALQQNLMTPIDKENGKQKIQGILRDILQGWATDSKEAAKSVQSILENLTLLLETCAFDTELEKATFWEEYRTGKKEELSAFQRAQFHARANSERRLSTFSPAKKLKLETDLDFSFSQVQARFTQLSRSLEPVFFAVFKIISSMKAKDDKKQEQIPIRLVEMQKVWSDEQKKLSTAEEGSVAHLFGEHIRELNYLMGSVSLAIEQDHENLVDVYIAGSKAETAITEKQQYFASQPLATTPEKELSNKRPKVELSRTVSVKDATQLFAQKAESSSSSTLNP